MDIQCWNSAEHAQENVNFVQIIQIYFITYKWQETSRYSSNSTTKKLEPFKRMVL